MSRGLTKHNVGYSLSVLFHPILVPIVLAIYSLQQLQLYDNKGPVAMFWIVLIIFAFGVPMLATYLFVQQGFARDIHLKIREERPIPLFISAISLMVLYYTYVRIFRLDTRYVAFSGAIGITLFLLALFSFKIKVSIHTASWAGLAGILAIQTVVGYDHKGVWVIAAVIFIASVVGTARLLCAAHSLKEINLGLLIGFLGGLAGQFIFSNERVAKMILDL
jgi:hypothetical protein